MQAASKGWTVQEEETIAHIMANENVGRIEAIQAMRRRKKTSKPLSHRLKFKDPFESSAHCQNRHCIDCALTFGETDLEMTAFLDLMLNGKQRSGDYFLVQRDRAAEMVAGSTVFRGLFPVSARMDGDLSMPALEVEADEWALVPKEPYEPALELTKDGIIDGCVYRRVPVRRGKSTSSEENDPPRPTEAISGANVDGLSPVSPGVTVNLIPTGTPIKRYAGRPRLSDEQKRLSAAERQARFREKKRKQSTKQAA